MNKHISRDSFENAQVAPEACQVTAANGERPDASAEMARVLGTILFQMVLDTSNDGIANRKHDPPHDVVDPMIHHVTSRLSLTAADAKKGNGALDTLFGHRLMHILAKHLLPVQGGAPSTFQPSRGGLSPTALRRAIERLRSNADASLATLASDARLSRFHFCRAFKESTGLSPHVWRRRQRIETAKNMLRNTDESVISIAVALGYSSQTAFAAAFRKLTGDTPTNWRKRTR